MVGGTILLTFTAIGLAAALAPNIVLGVTMGSLIALQPASDLYSYTQTHEDEHTKEKRKYARIAQIEIELRALRPFELAALIEEKCKVKGYKIEQFDQLPEAYKALIPALACHLYHMERVNLFLESRRKQLEKADQEPISERRTFFLREAFQAERIALEDAINAAFARAVLRHPFSQKSLDDIGTIPAYTAETYALEKLFGRTPPLFDFNAKGRAPLMLENYGPLADPKQIRRLSRDLRV